MTRIYSAIFVQEVGEFSKVTGVEFHNKCKWTAPGVPRVYLNVHIGLVTHRCTCRLVPTHILGYTHTANHCECRRKFHSSTDLQHFGTLELSNKYIQLSELKESVMQFTSNSIVREHLYKIVLATRQPLQVSALMTKTVHTVLH